jgi:hypothetical protein
VSLFIANPIHVACDSRPCRYPKRKAGNPKVLGGWFSSLYRTTAIMPNKKSSFVPLAHPRPSAPRGLDILCAELLKEADRRSAQPPREPAGRFSVGLAERRYPDGAAKTDPLDRSQLVSTSARNIGCAVGAKLVHMRSTVPNEGTGDGDMDAAEMDVTHARSGHRALP